MGDNNQVTAKKGSRMSDLTASIAKLNDNSQVDQPQNEPNKQPETQPQAEEATQNTVQQPTENEVPEKTDKEKDPGLENANGDNPTEPAEGVKPEGDGVPEESDKEWYETDGDSIFTQTSQTELPEGDYSAIGKAIGLDTTDSKEILSGILELKSQNEEYSEKIKAQEDSSVFANDDLAKANEIAKSGGNYAEYLGIAQNNWDAVDDLTLVVEGYLRPHFGEDQASLEAQLKTMSEFEIKREAANLRERLKAQDESQKQDILSKSREKVKKADQQVRSYLDQTESIAGLQITPAMKREIYDDVSDNNFFRKLFMDQNGNPDAKKIADTVFIVKNIKTIVGTAVSKARNQGVSDVLSEVSNPNVSRGGERVNLEPKKPVSAIDNAMNAMRSRGRR